MFVVHGYPTCLAITEPERERITLKDFTHWASLYDGRPERLEDYYHDQHVLFSLSHANSEGCPSLKGISGCSVWQATYEGQSPDSWSVHNVKIVAVQTGVYKTGTIIKGTYWMNVRDVLWTGREDLRQR